MRLRYSARSWKRKATKIPVAAPPTCARQATPPPSPSRPADPNPSHTCRRHRVGRGTACTIASCDLGSFVFLPTADGCDVRVISKRRLREFWESREADSRIAERDLSVWYKLATNAAWPNFAALKQTFGSA